MNPDSIQTLLGRLEDEHTERKLATNVFDRDKLYKYVAALANETGGHLILGVDDAGVARGTKAFLGKIPALKQELLNSKSLSRRIRVEIDETIHLKKRILIFSIPGRPVGEAVSYKGAYYMRSGESLVTMDFDTLSRIRDERIPDFSAEVIPKAKIDTLDPQAIATARKLWARRSNNPAILEMDDDTLLRSLELVPQKNTITRAAIILLGTVAAISKYAANSEVIWEFRRSSADIPYAARQEFKLPFLLYFDRLWAAVDSRNDIVQIQEGFLVRDLKPFNESVIREAVLNAVAHRDYRDTGSVFVRQSQDMIKITSPGGFLPGVTPENIVTISSHPRNRLIAEVFQKLGLVDRSGLGADRIFSETIAEGKGLPTYENSFEHEVVLEIGATIQDYAFLKYLENVTNIKQTSLVASDYVVLECVRQAIAVPSSLVNRVEPLVNLGFIEKIGSGRGSRLILSRRFYVAIGKTGEYTRRKGLDKNTNLEITIKHLTYHKKGFAKDLEDALPHLSRRTINRYLNELSKNGRIKFVGKIQIVNGPEKGYWELCS